MAGGGGGYMKVSVHACGGVEVKSVVELMVGRRMREEGLGGQKMTWQYEF